MPVACYADPFPAFQPAMRIVTAITQANPAQVTTSFAHQYKNGLIVRLDIPIENGMPEINGNTYVITVTGSTTFTVPVDSTNFTPFTNNVCTPVVPVGEINALLNSATQNVLPYSAT